MKTEDVKKFQEQAAQLPAADQVTIIKSMIETATETAEAEHIQAQESLNQKKITLDILKDLKA